MKILKFLIIIFISLTTSIKADLNKNLLNQLGEGGKLIFIRHAYAPGSGDPSNFNLNDCSTQRNLSKEGRKQAANIGEFLFLTLCCLAMEDEEGQAWLCHDSTLLLLLPF